MTASPPSARHADHPTDRDAACLGALGEIELLLRDDRPGEALQRARPLFDDALTPAWLMGDLCRLTAAAAQALGLMPFAETLWREAIERASDPADAADASLNLGVLLLELKRVPEAEACWRTLLDANPDHAPALANLAVLLADAGRRDEAEACHSRALALAPADPSNHSNLGVLLAAQHRNAEAETCYRQALALAPDDPKAHTNLGLLLLAGGRADEAEAHQRRALALAPRSAEIRSNLGNLLAARGAEVEAEACLREAIGLDPGSAAAHTNLAVLLADQGRDAEAEALFRAALRLRPGYPLARLDLSCLLLAQGRFDEGWTLHEARHDPGLPDNGVPPPNVALPAWQGEPLTGRALLVWPEQGLGDQIQFCRFAGRLKALGAARVTLVCQRPLRALFETLDGVDRVIAADIRANAFHVEPAELQGHDCWAFPLSLARLLGTDLATLPGAPIPYLRADPDRAPGWTGGGLSNAATPGRLRIGLVWRGNPLHGNDAERSLPGLATLAPLWSVPGVSFVALQTGRAGAEAATPPAGQPLLDGGAALRDFADTAAALAALDLLVCVDTSIAHLAGALGLPCWVLLPQRKTDWRWLRGRDDSPWYPLGMRLFRQAERGDWAPVVERVRLALTERVGRAARH